MARKKKETLSRTEQAIRDREQRTREARATEPAKEAKEAEATE
jgi:hypothetical protein